MTIDSKITYARMLDCPHCGCKNTVFVKREQKMYCNKCGNYFDRPPLPK